MSNSILDLISKETDKEQHEYLVEIETKAGYIKLQAILGRGELYKEFDGTQRECGEYFGVGQAVVGEYRQIFSNINLVTVGDGQEISKNKLLTIIREKKAEEHELEDFEIDRTNLHGGATYKSEDDEDIANIVMDLAKDESPEVKVKLTNKAIGIKNKREVLESDKSDEDKVKALTSKKLFKEVFSPEPEEEAEPEKETPKSHEKALEQNRLLREENKKLRDENKMLNKKLKDFDFAHELGDSLGIINAFLSVNLKKLVKHEKLLRQMPVELVAALNELKLSTSELPTEAELKRNYRDEAKRTHPDKENGSVEAFQKVKAAFDVVQKMI